MGSQAAKAQGGVQMKTALADTFLTLLLCGSLAFLGWLGWVLWSVNQCGFEF